MAAVVDLLDASVWLPLSVPDHAHHARARAYWEDEAAGQVAFCRITALALLRHLTNPRVVGRAAISGAAAWRALEKWLGRPGIVWLAEPSGIDEILAAWAKEPGLRAADWTDAYLAAFARASGCRIVAFDGDFKRYPGIRRLHLAVG